MVIKEILSVLSKAPMILKDMLSEIPIDILKQRRINGKWSIHEHVCHLCEAQKMMIERFKMFKTTRDPRFTPYLPGTDSSLANHLLDLDLQTCLMEFEQGRVKLVELLKSFSAGDWANKGSHPEYKHFTAKIFLRHIMMHDQLHMYRIEELWLTNDEYLPNLD